MVQKQKIEDPRIMSFTYRSISLCMISKNFIASQTPVNVEPFQRTDISTQPLEPITILCNPDIPSSRSLGRQASLL
jgi:hypothetical protein